MALIGISRDRRAVVLAGLFVAAGIGLAGVWVLLRVGEIAAGQTFYAEFPDVTGLRTGTDVQVAGYSVGSVRAIEPMVDGGDVQFRVQLLVGSDWPLPDGTTALLASPGLLAAPVIALDLGDGDAFLDPGTTVPTSFDASLGERLDDVVTEIERTVDSIAEVFDEDFPRIVASLEEGAELIDDVLARDLDPMMRDLRTAADTLDRSTLELEQDLDRVLGSLDNTTQTLEALVGSINIDTLAGAVEDTGSTVALANSALANFDSVAGNLNGLVDDVGPDLATVTTDAAFVLQQLSSSLNLTLLNLERASQELADLITDIRNNPSVLLTGREAE